MKIKKCFLVLMSFLFVIHSAVPVMAENLEMQNIYMESSELEISGTDSVGDLLAEVIAEEEQGGKESSENYISNLKINNTTAEVTYLTNQEADIIVAVYDEITGQMLASGTAEVIIEEEAVSVELIAEDSMPSHFIAIAYLLDAKNHTPLCEQYITKLYTQEMQEFFATTVDDYDPEKVLNLDEDDGNNIAVYNSDTIVADEESGRNELKCNEDGSYTITNADETFSSLRIGDVFSYNYEDGMVLAVKVGRIEVDGSTVTITKDETLVLEEVFDYVKIEGGCQDVSESEIQTLGIGLETEPSKTISFDKSKSFSTSSGSVTLNVSGAVTASAYVKIYIAPDVRYVESSLNFKSNFHASVDGKLNCRTVELVTISLVPVAGVKISVTPALVYSASGKIEFDAVLTAKVGFSYNNGRFSNKSSAPKLTSKIQAEAEVYLGFLVTPAISVLSEEVIEASVPAEFGVQIHADSAVSPEQNGNHLCKVCIAGTFTGRITVTARLKIIGKEAVSRRIVNTEKRMADFYYSADSGEFGWGMCPNQLKPSVSISQNSSGAHIIRFSQDQYLFGTLRIFDVTLDDIQGRGQTRFLADFENIGKSDTNREWITIYLYDAAGELLLSIPAAVRETYAGQENEYFMGTVDGINYWGCLDINAGITERLPLNVASYRIVVDSTGEKSTYSLPVRANALQECEEMQSFSLKEGNEARIAQKEESEYKFFTEITDGDFCVNPLTVSDADDENVQIANFNGLAAGKSYVMLCVKNAEAENLFSPDNLLYIAQSIADENGRLSFRYIPRADGEFTDLLYGTYTKEISDAEIKIDALTYNCFSQDVNLTVTYNDRVLEQDTDYTLSGDLSVVDAGIYSLTVTGIGEYAGAVTQNFLVKKAELPLELSLSKECIQPGETAFLSGFSARTVSYASSDTSVAEVDEYGNITGIAEGTAVITVKAVGDSNYNEKIEKYTVTVKADEDTGNTGNDGSEDESDILDDTMKEISDADIAIDELFYNGSSQDVNLTVAYNGKRLEQDIDYTLSGDLSVLDAGFYSVTVTGIGEYIGAVTQSFLVEKAELPLELSLSKECIQVGETVSLIGFSIGAVNYSSSDASIADVDEYGNITGIAEGAADITARAVGDSNYKENVKNFSVTVRAIGDTDDTGNDDSGAEGNVPDGDNNLNNGGNTENSENNSNSSGTENSTENSTENGNSNTTDSGKSDDAISSDGSVKRILKKGTKFTDSKSKAIYKVTRSDRKNPEVEYIKTVESKAAKITIPETVTVQGIIYKVTSVGSSAFKNNKKLKKAVIGKNVTAINTSAFSSCYKLTTVKLPKKLKVIGKRAFYQCKALTKITIPSKVNKIGAQAFYGDKKLKNIIIKTKKLTVKNVGKGAFKGSSPKAVVKVPKGKRKIYRKLLRTRGISVQAIYK